jgi:hypothetical protein
MFSINCHAIETDRAVEGWLHLFRYLMAVSGQLNALITSAPELSLFEDQWAPEHVNAVKAYRGNIGIDPVFLILGTCWRRRELHAASHFNLEERTPEGGWAPEPVWTFWLTKKLLFIPGLELRTAHLIA